MDGDVIGDKYFFIVFVPLGGILHFDVFAQRLCGEHPDLELEPETVGECGLFNSAVIDLAGTVLDAEVERTVVVGREKRTVRFYDLAAEPVCVRLRYCDEHEQDEDECDAVHGAPFR